LRHARYRSRYRLLAQVEKKSCAGEILGPKSRYPM
jgi:hypothetical protein